MRKNVTLREGAMGAGGKGHMDHPYDNTDLTFSQIKEMFKVASQGFPQVKVTEKLDGQNILISYNPVTQEALAVRNKTQARNGGITKQQLIDAFTTDRPVEKRAPKNVVDAFRESMENFEKIAKTVPGEYFITPEGGRIFYNAEVVDPRSVNVVDYDSQTLIIHRTGHMVFREGDIRTLDSSEAEQNAILLEEVLSDLQSDSIPIVKVNAVRDFTEFLEKKDAYRKVLANIDSTLREAGLSDSNTIEDFLKVKTESRIARSMPRARFSDSAMEKFVEAVVYFGKTSNMPRKRTEIANVMEEIPLELEKERNIVLETLSDRAALRGLSKSASRPLEMIVHKFAVEILENFKSAYVIQSDIAVRKLQSKVGTKMKNVRDAADDSDLSALEVGIRKLLNADSDEDVLTDESIESAITKITTVVEGLVFDFEGRTYKLTGNFAPINQIMGLGRYSKGKRDDTVLEEEEEVVDSAEERSKFIRNRKIAVFPGKFKPPHRGHMHIVEEVLNKGADMVIIMVSPLSKGSIKHEDSINIWNLYISHSVSNSDRIKVILSPYNSPVMSSYAIMDEPIAALKKLGIPAEGDLIIPVASTKPDEKGVSDIQRFAKYHSYVPKLEGITPANVGDWAVDPETDEFGAYNASDFRRALETSQDIERFIPDNVDAEEVRRILGFLTSSKEVGSTSPSTLDESLIIKLIYEMLSESSWQPIAKARMRKSMHRLLRGGNKKAAKHGAPFSKDLSIGNSNAFLAKESEEKEEEQIEEISAMAAGSVEIGSAPMGRKSPYDVWRTARKKTKGKKDKNRH